MKKKALRDILLAARPLSRLCPVILRNTISPEGDYLRVDHWQNLYEVRIYLRRYESQTDAYWNENCSRKSAVISDLDLRKTKDIMGLSLDSEDWEVDDADALKDMIECMQEDYDSIVGSEVTNETK